MRIPNEYPSLSLPGLFDHPQQDLLQPLGEVFPWDAQDLESSIPARFGRVARRYPNRPALSDAERSLNYGELDSLSNRLANALLATLGNQPEPVILLLDHGVQMLVAILGILKAGKFYAPLEASSPFPRQAAILADSGARLVLTNSSRRPQAEALAGDQADVIDLMHLISKGVGSYKDEAPGITIPAHAYLNLIYTSGSTGEPKGVLQNHRNVLFDTCASSCYLKFSIEDRFGLVVPSTFGASVSDIFGALLNGGTLLSLDLKNEGLVKMARWMRQQRITVTHMVPTVFRQWMNLLQPADDYPEMRVIKAGGEALLRSDWELFRRHFSGDCVLRNALGTTETYMVAFYLLKRDSQVQQAVVPVGFPAAGREVLVLDEHGNPVADGETGQISVRSRYLFPGYWRKTELTSRTLRPDETIPDCHVYQMGDLGRRNPDGSLEHLGRLDEMVKIRGQRVELGEVEAALIGLDGVQEAAVAARRAPQGDLRLVAYLVATGRNPDPLEVRRELAYNLPAHMLPSEVIFVPSLPLLAIGKVNRNALPEPSWDTGQAEKMVISRPVTAQATLAALASLWSQVLAAHTGKELAPVGAQDNFFELGGDSLSLTQLILMIEETFQVELTPNAIYAHPTLEKMSAHIEVLRQEAPLPTAPEDESLARGLKLLGMV